MCIRDSSEASQDEVSLPKTSPFAMLRIVHYLYGCRRWAGKDGCCRFSSQQENVSSKTSRDLSSETSPDYEDDLEMILDLVPLSDKYLLTDLNIIVCRMVVKQCTQNPEGKMKIAYKRSLNIVCPTTNNTKNKGAVNYPNSLSKDTEHYLYSSVALHVQLVAFLLAGNIRHGIRVKLFRELAKSDNGISSDFVDDVSQIITSCLKLALQKPKPYVIKEYSPKANKAYQVMRFRK